MIQNTESRFSSCVPDPLVELAELGVGVHAVTGAFKSFLKLLPEPIIPGSYQNAFQNAMSKLNRKMLDSEKLTLMLDRTVKRPHTIYI